MGNILHKNHFSSLEEQLLFLLRIIPWLIIFLLPDLALPARAAKDPCSTYGKIQRLRNLSGNISIAELKLRLNQALKDFQPKWTKETLVEAIQKMDELKIPLNAQSAKSYTRKNLASAGLDPVPANLYESAIKLFGSWDNALKAAGINPLTIRADMQKRKSLIALLKNLHKKKVPLRPISLMRIKSDNWVSLNAGETPYNLVEEATRIFGSWKAALRAAGLQEFYPDTQEIWTKYTVIYAIQDLFANGFPLNDRAIALISRTALRKNGLEFSPGTLSNQAKRIFGSWNKALLAAGIDPGAVSLHGAPIGKQDIISALQKINQDKSIPLNSDAVRSLSRSEANSLGLVHSGNALYHAAIREYGSWEMAITAAGINSTAAILDRTSLAKQKIIAAIHAIQSNGSFSLNYSSVFALSQADLRAVGIERSGKALVSAADHQFGSWDKALKAAGIDPKNIRLRRTSASPNVLSLPHQTEFTSGADGTPHSQTVITLGDLPQDPLTELVDKEFGSALKKAISQLPTRYQKITQVLLEYLYSHNSLLDLIEVANYASKKLATTVTPDDIKNTLRYLSEDESFRDLL